MSTVMDAATRYLIGIDLGTTNSAIAYSDTREPAGGGPVIRVFQVPQLVAEGEVAALPTLPSFLYLAGGGELSQTVLRLPWNEQPNPIVGVLAREQGALVPGRQVSSAKSWLCHSGVDRTAKILPWGAEQPASACSPVEASSAYLAHMRDAWNHSFQSSSIDENEWRFERQEIVLTVPASFDEEARELTVQAAREAGLERLTLLEEPLAAFYSWIASHSRALKRHLRDNQVILICDVGGGTTDFSLIRVRIVDGEVRFERTAIGEHLLLGGDNVDLALSRLMEERLGNPRLTLRQRNALRRQCCSAKERLMSDPSIDRLPISVLGEGRSVVGGSLRTELTRGDVEGTLLDGFLPLTSSDDLPARDKRPGLRELGLPYATEPAITRHLAQFLTRSQNGDSETQDMVRPDAILFNGGFFAPPVARERIVDAVSAWFRQKGKRYRPRVLNSEAIESAVAIGAAYYGSVRGGGGLRVSGGAARAYYIGVQGARSAGEQIRAVCVMPRGTEEGATLGLAGREFTVLTNQPVSFTLYSSTTRHDQHGDVVELNEDDVNRHAPLITVLRYGKRSRQAELTVQLTVRYTEVGTLELWCESRKTEHRWRLQFQLRGDGHDAEIEPEGPPEAETVIPDEAIASAERLIRATFGNQPEAVAPESLVGKLESAIGYGKDGWPMAAIRRLCDVMIDVAEGRKRSARYEARWLNLFGFCLRPGFGAAVDEWRMQQSRKIYLAGLLFRKDVQCQVEWLVLWRRVAGGLNAGQQQELYQKHMRPLGLAEKGEPRRINTQIEREGWRLLASLEYLPASARESLGARLLERLKAEPGNGSFLWSLGRMGARLPLYGPLNCVVRRDAAEDWITFLLKTSKITPDAASAIVQLGSRTGDPERDISDELRERAIAALTASGMPESLIINLREHVAPSRTDAVRIFGESLPEGLRLVG